MADPGAWDAPPRASWHPWGEQSGDSADQSVSVRRRRWSSTGCSRVGGGVAASETLEQYFAGLPPISADGGGEAEFQEYWEFWRRPRRRPGGWLERRVHPQLAPSKPLPYWYHPASREYAFEEPREIQDQREHGRPAAADEVEAAAAPPRLRREGPVWEMSCKELKALLRQRGQAARLGIGPEDLAARAVDEYESWLPRVQSWHDYIEHTFWFMGHDPSVGFTRESFADDAFYHALARLVVPRLQWMHPINIAYMTWTFSRPGVVVPEFMEAVGNHLVDGYLPMLDRCALCTLVWVFWKLQSPHHRFFEAVAKELKRPVRMRSLAPRNFQNTLIAYSRMQFVDLELFDRLAMGIRRLLDAHDPSSPKTATHVLFSYTCLSGHEVPADAFRINSLTVIIRAFNDVNANSFHVESCFESMADYVLRSMERSPPMMRDSGDAAEFVAALGRTAARLRALRPLLDPFILDLPGVLEGAERKSILLLQRGLYASGLDGVDLL